LSKFANLKKHLFCTDKIGFICFVKAYFYGVLISKDQIEDYAERKGFGLEEAERWLAPVLNYDV
jgi:hypothetical protein